MTHVANFFNRYKHLPDMETMMMQYHAPILFNMILIWSDAAHIIRKNAMAYFLRGMCHHMRQSYPQAIMDYDTFRHLANMDTRRAGSNS